MASEIKYLIFKGVSKKEQILLKSYLNLAKHELPYQIIVLKKEAQESGEPDFLITDELYQFKNDEQSLLRLPQIIIGQQAESKDRHYLTRPIRWSDFKLALAKLELISTSSDEGTIKEIKEEEALFAPVLPKINLSVDEDSLSGRLDDSEPSEQSLPGEEHGFELGKFSVDYDSFTNSEYANAVNDVNQFKEGQQGDEPLLLMTDEESSFTSSVLVLESDAADVWDSEEEEDYEFSQFIESDSSESIVETESVIDNTKGILINAKEPFWLSDNEILIDGKSILFIKKKRKMVYSMKAPGRWPEYLSNVEIHKSPMPEDWTPYSGLKSYPISYLVWAHELARNNEKLDNDITPNDYYVLTSWPAFELLQLDNKLLKLATLLFVNPESLESLVAKTSYRESDIIGFMNACFSYGTLNKSYRIDQPEKIDGRSKGSVLTKIKKVFQ